MSKQFDSVIASPMGEFVRSPLGVRETTSGEFGYILKEWSLDNATPSMRYNSGADSWSTRRADNTVRGFQAGVFGIARTEGSALGYRHGGQAQNLPAAENFKGMAEYTPLTDSWRRVHNTIFPHVNAASSSIADSGFTVGGQGTFTVDPYTKKTEVYFPDVDLWLPRSDWSIGRAHHGAVGLEERQYATGGIPAINSGASGAHFFYDEDTRTWNRMIFMAVPRYAHVALTPDGALEYVVGGATATRFRSPTRDVARSDVQLDVWNGVTAHPEALLSSQGFSLSDGLYTAGGFYSEWQPSTQNVYRFANETWVSRKSLPEGLGQGVTNQGTKL